MKHLVSVAAAALAVAALAVPAASYAASDRVTHVPAASNAEGGYFLPAPAFTTVSAKFTVPRVQCTQTDTGVAFAGAVFGPDMALSTAAAIDAKCVSGNASYTGVVAAGTTRSAASFTPVPGDRIQLFVTSTAAGTTALVDDVTQQTGTQVSGPVAPNTEAFVGVALSETPTNRLPAANFGKVHFAEVTLDGLDLGRSGATRTDLVSTTQILQSKTSPVSADKKSFTETFKHS